MTRKSRLGRTARRRRASVICGLAIAFGAAPVHAGESDAVLLPVQASERQTSEPEAISEVDAQRLSAELETIVREGLEDLGLSVKSGAALGSSENTTLAELAPLDWVIAPRLAYGRGSELRVTVIARAPGSRVLKLREERVRKSELAVKTVLMLRDLMGRDPEAAPPSPDAAKATAARPAPLSLSSAPPSSAGRPVLALNATLFGGFIGLSLQQASSSRDSRLVYPMAALGAGLGLGASLLVADEWDITSGDAWFLAAGVWWPGAAGFLLAKSYDVDLEERYVYGVLGATGGVAAATFALTQHRMSEGGALLTHSGGAFGTLFGAVGEVMVRGESPQTPVRGMGIGAGAGVLLAGALSTQVELPSSRVLLLDLGLSVGALGGAALGSPLLLVDESDPLRTRLWLAAVTAGAIGGAVVAYYATDSWSSTGSQNPSGFHVAPFATALPDERGANVTLGVLGSF
jgi:hypothetical protein